VVNPYDGTYNGDSDVFVSKLSPSGNTLVYSTYLGGSDDETFWASHGGIAVDGSGNTYVTGTTYSVDFPMENPYDDSLEGWLMCDAFVSKFSPTGETLVYSTYLGGSKQDFGNGIVVDGSGNAYVTGDTYSVDFPVVNPYDGTLNQYGFSDVFVSKFSPIGNALVYSTYLGGSVYDVGYGIAIDGSGNAYVTGITHSVDFPLENPYDDTYNGNYDGFVSKFVQNAGNQPPDKPTIDGPTNGEAGIEYTYTFTSTEPDGNDVFYYVDWGDDASTWWFGPYASGATATASHTWSRGSYEIRVKAKDTDGAESEWSDPFPISMPRGKLLPSTLFLRLFERYPNAFPILRQILGL